MKIGGMEVEEISAKSREELLSKIGNALKRAMASHKPDDDDDEVFEEMTPEGKKAHIEAQMRIILKDPAQRMRRLRRMSHEILNLVVGAEWIAKAIKAQDQFVDDVMQKAKDAGMDVDSMWAKFASKLDNPPALEEARKEFSKMTAPLEAFLTVIPELKAAFKDRGAPTNVDELVDNANTDEAVE